MEGLLLIDKEAGMTSRAIDNALQRFFHTRKVGHLGTLDPFATGLLIVAVGSATKYLPFLPDEEKTYVATLRLGRKTDTGDLTGNIIDEKPVKPLQKEEIEQVLRGFLGAGKQIPPMTSAIKKDGVALYVLAHRGEEIQRQARDVFIHDIRLLSHHDDEIVFETIVSKGTYIRTLGEDIAEALGTVGHLVGLRRSKVGHIDLTLAVRLSMVSEDSLLEPSYFLSYPRVNLDEAQSKKARNGMKLPLPYEEPRLLLLDEAGPIAVYERQEDGVYRCLRGL